MRVKHWLMATIVTAAAVLAAAVAASGLAATRGSDELRIFALTSDRTGIEAVLKIYERRNPNVDVRITYADAEPFQSTLRTQLAAGTAADVFQVWPGNGNPGAIQVLVPGGYLADLSGRAWAKRTPAGLRPVTRVNGKTYTLPLAFSGIGALYNMSALAKVGKRPPTTFNQVLALCDAAKEQDMVAFALGIQDSWVTQLIPYAFVPTTVYRTNPSFDAKMRAGKATFARSGWVTAMNKYLTMNARGCFNESPLGTGYEQSLTQVAQGRAIGVIQGTWALGGLRDQAKGTRFALHPVPATNVASQTWMPGAAGAAWGVNAKARNRDLALRFVDFLATPTAMNAFVRAAGSLPAFPNAQYKADAALASLVRFQRSGKTVPFMDQLWPNPRVQAEHLTGLQDVFAGKKKAIDVLRAMDRAYRSGR
jgi:raffinose/stachyose/melibiose transport system substrate-binding protein